MISWKLSLPQGIHGCESFRIKMNTQHLPSLIQTYSMEPIIIHADMPKIERKTKIVPPNILRDSNLEEEEENLVWYQFLRWNYHIMMIGPLMIVY